MIGLLGARQFDDEGGALAGALSQRIVPPCSATTCCTNGNPRPVPLGFVLKNGLKIC